MNYLFDVFGKWDRDFTINQQFRTAMIGVTLLDFIDNNLAWFEIGY